LVKGRGAGPFALEKEEKRSDKLLRRKRRNTTLTVNKEYRGS